METGEGIYSLEKSFKFGSLDKPPPEKLSEGIRNTSEGGLDVHPNKIKDNDFGRIFDEFNRFADKGLGNTEYIEKSISETASTAEENTASSEETSAAIEEDSCNSAGEHFHAECQRTCSENS